MKTDNIIILGVGNVLFSDEGFGIRVIEVLKDQYVFAKNVSIIDGGVLGINLMGIIAQADKLIVVDVIRNNGSPGDIHRIEGEAIPDRIRAKNSLHQIDFLEALTLSQALEKTPETLILGIEPQDIETLKPELTTIALDQINNIIFEVLKELDHMKIKYKKIKEHKDISAVWNGGYLE